MRNRIFSENYFRRFAIFTTNTARPSGMSNGFLKGNKDFLKYLRLNSIELMKFISFLSNDLRLSRGGVGKVMKCKEVEVLELVRRSNEGWEEVREGYECLGRLGIDYEKVSNLLITNRRTIESTKSTF